MMAVSKLLVPVTARAIESIFRADHIKKLGQHTGLPLDILFNMSSTEGSDLYLDGLVPKAKVRFALLGVALDNRRRPGFRGENALESKYIQPPLLPFNIPTFVAPSRCAKKCG